MWNACTLVLSYFYIYILTSSDSLLNTTGFCDSSVHNLVVVAGNSHSLYYCAISINSAGHVTRYMPAEILNSAHGGNDRYKYFFSADFYDFFAIFKAFFTTSFYGFGTWPKWPLQPLHFGVFGAAVTRYCRIDRNGTVPQSITLSLSLAAWR